MKPIRLLVVALLVALAAACDAAPTGPVFEEASCPVMGGGGTCS